MMVLLPLTFVLIVNKKTLYDPVIDSINIWFRNNWEGLTNKEKMKWKYQRYMQDYLGCISSVDVI